MWSYLGQMLNEIDKEIPDEDAPGWTPLTPYTDDVFSSTAYCLECLQTGLAQDATWAARRVYEALDHFVGNKDNAFATEIEADADINKTPVIQTELYRQARDLAELNEVGDHLSPGFLDILRKRSESEQAIDLTMT
ncbi:hypothetical protein SH661x_003680 [Planctomicrobium sp. SH661]|uniref:hypothetical protein n=1 Tax=Planctomicrobium sp. SH661 TaxID=3448124 RepID=UPI003F5BC2B6